MDAETFTIIASSCFALAGYLFIVGLEGLNMSLSLEEERALEDKLAWHIAECLEAGINCEVEQAQRVQVLKTITALEQLEQAREALEYCRDESTDIWIGRKAEAALEALKQQEVGND